MGRKKHNGVGSIVRILWKNTDMQFPGKLIYQVLAGLAILCIIVPCMIVVGFMSYAMTEALAEVNYPGGGILFQMQLLSAFSMVFSILVLFSVLFFSSDREHLVTLPIPAHHLMMAKFIYAYIAESVMEFFVLLAVFAGYFVAMGQGMGIRAALHPISLLAALLGAALVPLVPMIYCACFCLLLMAGLGRIRSTKIFYGLSGVVLLMFGGLFLFSLRDLGEINMENYVEALGSGRDLFLRTLNRVFFPVPWLEKAISGRNLGYLVLYLLIHVVLLAFLYGLGKLCYQKGLYTAASLGSGKKVQIRDRDFRKQSPFAASLRKEMSVLLRTRAFANNCAYVNLIWPLGCFLLFHFAKDDGVVANFILLYRLGRDRADMTLTIAVIAMALIATALNSIASTAFTREGQHLSLIKFIPVSYSTQLRAKMAVSTIFTYPMLVGAEMIVGYYVGIKPSVQIYYAVLMLLAHVIAVMTGIGMDSVSPYVAWDDEYSALRGNLNTFFSLAVMMLLTVVVVGVCLVLFEVWKLPLIPFYGVVFLALAVGASVAYCVGSRKILKNMENL